MTPVRSLLPIAGGLASMAVAWPWNDYVGHAHWARVAWIPFISSPFRPLDVAANLLLFMPLGAASAVAFRRAVVIAGITALVMSAAVELAQVFSHGRVPSATDVTCNVAGAILAARAISTRMHTHA